MPTEQEYREYLANKTPPLVEGSINNYCSALRRIFEHEGLPPFSLSDISELDAIVPLYERGGPHEVIGDVYSNAGRSALRAWREYVFEQSPQNTSLLQRATYLLTWNPELYQAGGNAGVREGETERWSCNSTKPQPGDRVYLVRLGTDPRGLVARGTVTEGTFKAEDWRDPTKTRSYIHFKAEETRPDCASGLLPMVLLELLSQGEFKWNAQSSGIAIPPELAASLDKEWDAGRRVHSLAQCARWYQAKPEWYESRWRQEYLAKTEAIRAIQSKQHALDDDTLNWLWREDTNGICTVSPDHLSNDEYEKNIDLLRELAALILQNPGPDTYQRVCTRWETARIAGLFRQTYTAVIHRVFAAVAPALYTTLLKVEHCRALLGRFARDFELTTMDSHNWPDLNDAIKLALRRAGVPESSPIDSNILIWMLYAAFSNPRTEMIVSNSPASSSQSVNEPIDMTNNIPLNQILFGPPGTGKTYHTINKALAILDPEFLAQHQGESNIARKALKARFDELAKAGRIDFVTFHQSFSYEDFVEGIRAVTDNTSKQLRYEIVDGIFKSCCMSNAATVEIEQSTEQSEPLDLNNRKIIHFRFGERGSSDAKIEAAINSGQIKFDDIDAEAGDFIILADGNTELRAIGKVTNSDHQNKLTSVSWLKVFVRPLPLTELIPNPSAVHKQYKLKDKRVNFEYLKELIAEPQQESVNFKNKEKKVLIIDEINRGNISRIFGELITLIEPSKRQGADEALEVVLPYSKSSFSVPDNLYLIGTMNTADRSLAGLDIALRRRFTFVEMPPKPELLADTEIDGVNIGKLLDVMNQRIEVLLDRDHCLGHAYFLPLKQKRTLDKLAVIFKSQIIPLLQEYFFEDWERIHWVLNGQQADDKSLCFIQPTANDSQFSKLFGESLLEQLQDRRWQINESAFKNIESYRQILKGA